MTTKRIALIGLHLALALATAAPGFAQDAGWTELSAFPKGNYRVRMTDGVAVRGQLQRMSPETLSILVDGQARELPMSQVEKVERSGNGALRGLVIGAAIGAVLGATGECNPEYDATSRTMVDKHRGCIVGGGISTGVIGLLIGWPLSRHAVIYRRVKGPATSMFPADEPATPSR